MSCQSDAETQVKYKKGDTFFVTAKYSDSAGAAIDLAAITITGVIKTFAGVVIAYPTLVILNQTTNKGYYTFSADTSAWPIGTLLFEYSYTQSGVKTTPPAIEVVIG